MNAIEIEIFKNIDNINNRIAELEKRDENRRLWEKAIVESINKLNTKSFPLSFVSYES